jgi:hypothetical protein
MSVEGYVISPFLGDLRNEEYISWQTFLINLYRYERN